MMFSVYYTDQAVRELKKLDKYTRKFILAWIEKNLVGCSDPRALGKGLKSNRVGQWRYRLGDYRLLVEIQDQMLIILVLTMGHRSDIYK